MLIVEDGQLVIKPMRYRCRPNGLPESFDEQYPGCYNARRSSLCSNFWKPLFGHKHGLVLVDLFYEKVLLNRLEGRELRPGEKEQKVELAFTPTPAQVMLVPCIWDRWSAPGKRSILSFAAITDEPPPEVQAAGHDRCLIPIKQRTLMHGCIQWAARSRPWTRFLRTKNTLITSTGWLRSPLQLLVAAVPFIPYLRGYTEYVPRNHAWAELE